MAFQQNLLSNLSDFNAASTAAVYGILSAINTPIGPTKFKLDDFRKVLLSVVEVNGQDVVQTPAGGFTLALQRSIDDGDTWQDFATFTAVYEGAWEATSETAMWRFVLKVKGTNSVRVMARV